jgi:hypothetical protein
MTKTYIIFSVTEINKINLDEVSENLVNHLRKNIDNTKTIVKWYGDTPPCILQLTTIQGFYNYEEIIAEMNKPEWNF